MKYLAKNDDVCIKCGECERVCAKAFFKTEDVHKSAIHITDDKQIIKVCNQCGVCIDICPSMAISRDRNGIVRIDKNQCVGCFMCVGFCPEEAMMYHDDYIEPFKCLACGLCSKKCPTGAIFIEEKAEEQVAASIE